MTPPPLPPNEADRLAALRQLLILDTPPEERFDRITAFAQREFGVPTVLISMVDGERQWFKSKVGLAACETPRSISFCGHAILQEDVMVVADARTDARFSDNPLVTGEPFIRFYAGAPLVLPSGHAVGTLCLISPELHTYDFVDEAIHRALRDLVVEELQRREGES
jgi:GAF domain-containing protein